VTALGAKLAKADGRVDGGEFAAFTEVFQPDPASEQNIHRLYDLARQTTHGFESYARRLAKRYSTCPQLLEDVVDGLFHIAKADGVVTQDELDYLERVSDLFGMSPLAFRRLRATHLGVGPTTPMPSWKCRPTPTTPPCAGPGSWRCRTPTPTAPAPGACPANSSRSPRPRRLRSTPPSRP
jgi:uncharacterized tellurite resistance protein B-like protein